MFRNGVDEITKRCPVFGKGVFPYKGLIDEFKGITANCSAFKDGCPLENLKTVGEYLDKLA